MAIILYDVCVLDDVASTRTLLPCLGWLGCAMALDASAGLVSGGLAGGDFLGGRRRIGPAKRIMLDASDVSNPIRQIQSSVDLDVDDMHLVSTSTCRAPRLCWPYPSTGACGVLGLVGGGGSGGSGGDFRLHGKPFILGGRSVGHVGLRGCGGVALFGGPLLRLHILRGGTSNEMWWMTRSTQ